jgi:beta-galactosidase/beta-glucuronidase
MSKNYSGRRALIAMMLLGAAAFGGNLIEDPHENFGPYNVSLLAGGVGLERPLSLDAAPRRGGAAWSVTGWINVSPVSGSAPVVVVGDAASGAWHGLELSDGRLALVLSAHARTDAVPVESGRWYAVAASFDGRVARLYLDGREMASAAADTDDVPARLQLAPARALPDGSSAAHFGGRLCRVELLPYALSAQTARERWQDRPDFDVVVFEEVGAGWPLQERAWRGLLKPQDPWTLPKAMTPPRAPVAEPLASLPDLVPRAAGRWQIGDWFLRAATDSDQGATLSRPGVGQGGWFAAVVPGTVLTTLVARGVYPDPNYGLNNLVIPESLAHQDYWYRSEFVTPAHRAGERFAVTFQGINYAAEAWLNGVRLGEIRGAFIRGRFDVSTLLKPSGRNALAVRISPPPHPGIPHEQSVRAGPGENGGAQALDGPTFIATEGWDWIPGIRDRNSGIWQAVELEQTGSLHLKDAHVVTRLPLPHTDSAEVFVEVPVENASGQSVAAKVSAEFDGVSVERAVTLMPGVNRLRFAPDEYPALRLKNPRLWWPNGYGAANLYTLHLKVEASGMPADESQLTFGVRELTYELSLFDRHGALRRVEVDPAASDKPLIDVRHAAIKRTPQGWAESLTAAAEQSAAVRSLSDTTLTPYLAIRVNGVPIAARGGSWGMDDDLKRVSRAHLEPYFQLERAANLNIVRNWLGQDTEEVFYQLADEYGFLVLNDFWVSTQDFQLEPQDPALFLDNARDVISRYRNHPSIAVWFGRNEGVPQPILNEGLADLVASLDGTRYYTGSSNSVNLQVSGPYNYRPPEQYFTSLAKGFAVEVGSPSLSTLESLRASIPAADQWPLGDVFAYHDWHFGGNGDVASFMSTLETQFGAATGLPDFERKAQMMDFVTYRAIFEGFQAELWTRNSGRLLWMTHPSWPSNTWQIYSSDFDTAAAYYGVKKACEPVHAQMNLPDFSLAVVNIGREPRRRLTLETEVRSLDDRILIKRKDSLNAAADATATLAPLNLGPLLSRAGVVLVSLKLRDSGGRIVSQNLYWPGRDEASLRALAGLEAQAVQLTTRIRHEPQDEIIGVEVTNRSARVALGVKLTAQDETGTRVLPAFYSDNYLNLLPGDSAHVDIRCPSAGAVCARVAVRGFNVKEQSVGLPRRATVPPAETGRPL